MAYDTRISNGLALAGLLFREWISYSSLERRPEPDAAMESEDSVAGFHREGAQSLVPVYHFNALAISRLTPPKATIVDLGSGSAQFLAYLAMRRPDIKIIGIDLSPAMVATGQRFISEIGLSDRVDLRQGDMTSFMDSLNEPADLVSSVFSLHHLPTQEDLGKCLREVKRLRDRFGCAVWVFDHVRPRHPATPHVFPEVFTPRASAAFRQDSSNSLQASWAYQELVDNLTGAGLNDVLHACARIMRLYQTHWIGATAKQADGHHYWQEGELSPEAKKDFAGLKWLLPEAPG